MTCFLVLSAWVTLAVAAYGYVGLDGSPPIVGMRIMVLIFPGIFLIYLIYSSLTRLGGHRLIISGLIAHILIGVTMVSMFTIAPDVGTIIVSCVFVAMSAFWVCICFPRFTIRAEQGAAANP